MHKQIQHGNIIGVIIGTDLHLLDKHSASRYELKHGMNQQHGYYCSYSGVSFDLMTVVHEAKEFGVTRIVLRDTAWDNCEWKDRPSFTTWNHATVDDLPVITINRLMAETNFREAFIASRSL